MFGAGAWPPLGVREHKIFSGAVFSLYRATLGLRHEEEQHVSLATICSLLALPDHATMLRVEQLRYLMQLCKDAPDALAFARVKATRALPDPSVGSE